MQYRELSGVAEGVQGVIFFAQCLDEMLYEYTAASYKPRVMGLRALAIEAESVIARVEAGAMDRARLYPIMDELRARLSGDSVAKSLLSFPVDYYCSYEKDEKIKSITVRLGLLKNALGQGRYRKSLEHEIIKVCHDPAKKQFIRECLRSWVSAVSGAGISSQFIRTKLINEFFGEEVKYVSPADIASFFKIFDVDKSNFDVIFCTGSIAEDLSSAMDKFSCEMLDATHESSLAVLEAGVVCGDHERLVRVSGVEARDIYTARFYAERRMDHLSDLFALFHHKNRLRWRAEVVVQPKDGLPVLVNPRPASVKRSRDNVPRKASEKMAMKVAALNFSDRESVGRFVSVVRLHGSALEAASPQAQIVNLWTAMEVLVSRDSESKLRGVKKCLTPFLVHGYFDRLLFGLAGDLYRWKRKPFSKLLKNLELPGWSKHQKLAALLLDGEFERQRQELYDLAAAYPLLMNRIFIVSKSLDKPETILQIVASHEQRVSWQIERIYRARNFIVHDGSAPPPT